ncbi:hypothetical protein [uncultured Pedobacter sp.]|uniref:hypothetical protein n=1 Tax=uncultured Pedobacter sp. TaxID=246139 RepID=UPI002628A7DC|nr:hypothetical protein [uncultured Pedobacter sp.]
MSMEIAGLLSAVKALSEKLREKQWDGQFMTNAGYPDSLTKSVERYLYQSMLGNETGIGRGLLLSTYAQNGETGSVTCDFSVRTGPADQLVVHRMAIREFDYCNRQVSLQEIQVLQQEQILSRQDVLKKLNLKKKEKELSGRKRIRI